LKPPDNRSGKLLEGLAAPGTKGVRILNLMGRSNLAVSVHIFRYFPSKSVNVSNGLQIMSARPDCSQALDLKDFSEIRRRMPEKILFSRIEAMQRKSP